MADPDQRGKVVSALSEPHVAGAFARLLERGCEDEQLLALLDRLRRAEAARTRSKRALKKLARRLDRTAAGVAELVDWTESGHLGLPDDPKTWLLGCSHDLRQLAQAIRTRSAALDTRRTDPRLRRARQRLVRYVLTRTGDTCDTDVAIVIAAILRWDTYDVAQHAQWRAADADGDAVSEEADARPSSNRPRHRNPPAGTA
jgi:hypothetical protein